MCMFVFIDADSWNWIVRNSLRCMKKLREERKVLLKIVTNSFPKKYTSSFKYMKRREGSWEVHNLYVFRRQQDKKNFRSAALVSLYQVKLNIAPGKTAMPNKTLFCWIFWQINRAANYQELGKKKKNLLRPGYYPWECRTESSETKQSRKSSHLFNKYVLW